MNILAINPLYFETFWPTNENARGARNEQRCAECANTLIQTTPRNALRLEYSIT